MKGCVDPWMNQHNSSSSHPSIDYKKRSPPHFKDTPFFTHLHLLSKVSKGSSISLSLDFEGVSSFIL
ncbi:hypothetical protein LINPERPRIM_LOCUS27536 [Linum perenne]